MILINFATKYRPTQLRACLENIREKADGEYKIAVKTDLNDDSDYSFLAYYKEVIHLPGESTSKIHAINRDIPDGWDILLNHSDDMWIVWDGFDTLIKEDFQTYAPDFDGVFHYPDGNRSDLMTYSVIGRKYYERDGYVYHPSYISTHCDDEAQAVAKIRGKYHYIPCQLFDHRHYAFGKATRDRLYLQNDPYYRQDELNLIKRRDINFNESNQL